MANIDEAYQCYYCSEVYGNHSDAQNCPCRDDDVVYGYICLTCDTFYEDKTEAEECCPEETPLDTYRGIS